MFVKFAVFRFFKAKNIKNLRKFKKFDKNIKLLSFSMAFCIAKKTAFVLHGKQNPIFNRIING